MTYRIFSRAVPIGVLAGSLAVFALPAVASVAWKPVYGTRGIAIGGAVVATGWDASATLVNPALLTEIDGHRVDFGTLMFYRPDEISFERTPDVLAPAGYSAVSVESLSVAPYGGVVYSPEGRDWAFGFGVNVPFADKLDWPEDGPNRYWSNLTEFSFVYLTPAFAWRVHPKLSIGAGIDYVIFDGKLQSNVDFGSLAGQPENPAFDGTAVLSGDGSDWGVNVGVLFSPFEGLDLGLSFLTGVSMTAAGSRDITVPIQLQQALGFPASISFTRQQLDLKLPDIWRFGFAWQVREQWKVFSEIQVLDRSKERFLLRNEGSTSPGILPDGEEDLIPVPFSTARSYKAGAERSFGRWAYRFGIAFDENGVPEASVSPAGLDTDKLEVTAGFGYQWDRVSLDFAYARVIGDDRDVTASQVVNRVSQLPANGRYELNTHIVTVGFSFRF